MLEDLLQSQKTRFKHLYGRYSINKPYSALIFHQNYDYFAALQRAGKLHKSLDAHLIAPIKRMGDIHLLLHEVERKYKRAQSIADDFGLEFDDLHTLNTISEAKVLADEIHSYSDNMMLAGRIENFDGNVTCQGLLLLTGEAYCIKRKEGLRPRPERKRCQIFIFQKSVVVCKKVPKPFATQGDSYPDQLFFWTIFEVCYRMIMQFLTMPYMFVQIVVKPHESERTGRR